MAPSAAAPVLRGLVVDWGGVLTSGIGDSITAWAAEDGVDYTHYSEVMREWFDDAGTAQPRLNPVISLERGELEVADFERHLAEALRLKGSPQIPVEGLLGRMFARFDHAPEMAALVSRAHRSGVRTALLSNSWGNTYQREGWTEMFDAVVISAEVGMRKPEPGIFAHTLELIGLQARECVFVDDLADNVAAAVELGFVGVVHRSYAETAAELDVLFGRVLSA